MVFVGSSVNAIAALSNTVLVVLTMILILMEGATVPGKPAHSRGTPKPTSVTSDALPRTCRATFYQDGPRGIHRDPHRCGRPSSESTFRLGLIAFLLNYIPNIGSILAAVPACLLALIQLGPGIASLGA